MKFVYCFNCIFQNFDEKVYVFECIFGNSFLVNESPFYNYHNCV